MDTINTIQQVLVISVSNALSGGKIEPIFNYKKDNAKSKEISLEKREETLNWIKEFNKKINEGDK